MSGRYSVFFIKLTVIAAIVIAALQPYAPVRANRAQAALVSPNIVISQIFGGNGTVYTHDYIVLFNRSASPVSLNGWSLQYASGAGNFGISNQMTALPNFTLQPGQSFLVRQYGTTGGEALPTPDATGTVLMNGVTGKLALVASTNLLPSVACPDPSLYVDLVGYGGASCAEGSAPATMTNTTALQRYRGGCTDTGNNANDLTAIAPAPKNSSSPLASCANDVAPRVTNVSPGNGATNVARNAALSVTFDEPVNVSAGWFSIACPISGRHTNATFSGSLTTFTIQHPTPFAAAETCTVTVGPAGVSDQDSIDPPDNPTAGYSWSFTTVPPNPTDPSATGEATPTEVPLEDLTLLTVRVTPGSFPNSTNLAVTADLRAIGGPTSQTLFDNGRFGDQTAGDLVFSFQTSVRANTLTGDKVLPVRVTDSQNRTATTTIALTVVYISREVSISQIYMGGGSRATQYKNDYVELFNHGGQPVSLAGWSLFRASPWSSVWTRFPLPDVTLQPGQYFLIKGTSMGDGRYELPYWDLDLSNPANGLYMNPVGGKVILSYSSAPLPVMACPSGPSRVDMVGWGQTSNCFELSRAPGIDNLQALLRAENGCQDSNNNAADFSVINAYQANNPRYSGSAFNPCPFIDSAPMVTSHLPMISANQVPLNAVIQVNFNEPVSVSSGWFTLTCSLSGVHSASTYAGGPVSFQIDPEPSFQSGDICSVRVNRAAVNDQDGSPTPMASDYTWTFSTLPNNPPTVSAMSPVTINEDQSTGPLAFTVTDEAPASLQVFGTSDDPLLVPDSRIQVTCSPAGACQATVTPTPNQSGLATITLVAVDPAGESADATFLLTVNPVNDAPVISALPDTVIIQNSSAGPLNFTVQDEETSSSSLTVTATSNNTALVPNAGIAITSSGTGSTRALTVTPVVGQHGTARITVTVSDGSLSSSASFNLTVTPLNNTAPTISDIADVTITEDGVAGPTAFTIGDGESRPANLILSAASSNPALAPASAVMFGGSGAARTFTIAPLPNQNGTAVITITVSDGALTSSQDFTLTVDAQPDAPTISPIPDFTGAQDSPTVPLAFTIGDPDVDPNTLVLTATSSNTVLVPNANIALSGSGTNRAVVVTPAAGQSGTAQITITVSDGALTASSSFRVTFSGTNTIPAITVIGDRTTPEDTPLGPLAFTVGDGQTPPGSLQVTATAANTTLLPPAGIVLGGSGANRTLTLTPGQNQSGSTQVTLTVSDGSLVAYHSFTLTVTPVNDPPTISSIGDQTTPEDTPLGPLAISVGDIESGAAAVTLRVSASNPFLLPAGSLTLGGAGANRTLTITPAENEVGTATITLTASDGTVETVRTFTLTVTPRNDAPTLSAISDLSTAISTPIPPQPFTVGDIETAPGSLTLTGTSSNTTLVPNGNITFGGSGANRLLNITPATGQSGTTNITITVSDGDQTGSVTFALTVSGVNTAPTLSRIGNQSTPEDTSTGQIAFTVGDNETTTSALLVTATSANPAVVSNDDLILSGSGASRTLTIHPVANATGNAVITVSVFDGALTTNRTFTVEVTPVNDPPTISDFLDTIIEEDSTLSPITFTIGDIETPAAALTVTATSNDPILLPNANIVLGGSGATRTLSATPAANRTGFALITVSVSDGTSTTRSSFTLTVTPASEPPTISAIANQTVQPGSPPTVIRFTVTNVDNPNAPLALSATSSNTALVPVANIVFGGSGTNRTVTITPTAGVTGRATIEITVSNGTRSASTRFTFTVGEAGDGYLLFLPLSSKPANMP